MKANADKFVARTACSMLPRGFSAFLAFLISVVGTPAFAEAPAASTSGVASATIISPITVMQIDDLDFGIVSTDFYEAGGVTVHPGTSRTIYSNGAREACDALSGCPRPHRALFAVKGERGRSYSVAVPDSFSLPGGGGLDTKSDTQSSIPLVTDITVQTDSQPHAGAAGKFDEAGADRFGLGGKLNLPPDMAPARYRATIPVIVSYL